MTLAKKEKDWCGVLENAENENNKALLDSRRVNFMWNKWKLVANTGVEPIPRAV